VVLARIQDEDEIVLPRPARVVVELDPLDVLTDFVLENGDARGRPVGVALDKQGSLLVADDVGNAVWRVTGEPRSADSSP
jgi:glucose/arabinose dehydrogenase